MGLYYGVKKTIPKAPPLKRVPAFWEPVNSPNRLDYTLYSGMNISKQAQPQLISNTFTGTPNSEGSILTIYRENWDRAEYWNTQGTGTAVWIFSLPRITFTRGTVISWSVNRTTAGGSSAVTVEVSQDKQTWTQVDSTSFAVNGEFWHDVVMSTQNYIAIRVTMTGTVSSNAIRIHQLIIYS